MATATRRPPPDALHSTGLSARAFIAAVVLIAVAATLPYLPTLGHDFIMDDGVQITKNPAVTQGAPVAAYFVDKATIASRVDYRTWYRPIRTVGFRAIAAAYGLSPRAFGGVNLALYAVAVVLFAVLALRLAGGDRLAALVATAWWAALPVHVEPVSYYSALGDMLSLVLELGALLAALRAIARPSWAWPFAVASLLLAALAMGAKEMALTEGGILFVGVACGWRRLPEDARRRALALLVGHAAVTLAYFALHHHIIGALGQGAISARVVAGGLGRAPLYLWAYVKTIGWPLGHAAAYANVAVGALGLSLAWLGVVAVAGLVWRAHRTSPGLTFALGWFVVALVPVLHLVPLLSYYADRFALVPSVGLGAAVAVVLAALRGRARQAALVVAALVAAIDLGASARQARAWRSDLTLWEASVAAQPRAALAQSNFGLALLRERRPVEALEHLAAAEALDGKSAAVLVGSAAAQEMLGHAAAAEAAAREAVAADDGDARAHVILGGLEARRGDLDGAAREAERARTLNPELASAWTLTAHLDDVRGRTAEALAAWRRAAALVPANADYQAEVARLSIVTGDRAAAVAAIRACLYLRPDDNRCRALGAAAGSP
jgi:Flp pilus assembly protein TadD